MVFRKQKATAIKIKKIEENLSRMTHHKTNKLHIAHNLKQITLFCPPVGQRSFFLDKASFEQGDCCKPGEMEGVGGGGGGGGGGWGVIV